MIASSTIHIHNLVLSLRDGKGFYSLAQKKVVLRALNVNFDENVVLGRSQVFQLVNQVNINL